MTVDAIMLNRDTPRAAGLQGVSVCRSIIANLIANSEPEMTCSQIPGTI
jgi:hypothetical protein